MRSIFVWLGLLAGASIAAASVPMHPMLRLAVICAAFVMAVGAVVAHVNRGQGPDVVPGGKSRAQLEVDVDQLAARLSGLLERQASLEASLATASSKFQEETRGALEFNSSEIRRDLTTAVEAVQTASQEKTAQLSADLREALAKVDPAQLVQVIDELKARVDGIFHAADVAFEASRLAPKLSAVLEKWRVESKRQPTPRQIAARDNFIADNIDEANLIAESMRKYTNVIAFDEIRLDTSRRRALSSATAQQGSFSNENEVKSWVRSQSRVEIIVESLHSFSEVIQERQQFAAEVRSRKTPSELAVLFSKASS